MRWTALLILSAALPAPLLAEVLPEPGDNNPRIQSVEWSPNQDVLLTALPETGLTVVLEPGEEIIRVSLTDQTSLAVTVSSERDSFLVLPAPAFTAANLTVQTDRRDYRFRLRTGTGLTAAYLVAFDYSPDLLSSELTPFEATGKTWLYRVRGDRVVRPSALSDDGVRTRITFGEEQALPAVFAIGPSGDEQVVNGYMRGDQFVIDRVYERLVFRIDKEKATARRNKEAEAAND